jgi:AGCS family alanine or glycine:cation symporter
MTERIAAWNDVVNSYIWGPPMLMLLMGTGLLLTLVTGAVQFRWLA